MFLQASVCPHGGCLPQCMLGYHTPPSRHPSQEQTPPRADTPWGADTPLSRHPLGADTPPIFFLFFSFFFAHFLFCLHFFCICLHLFAYFFTPPPQYRRRPLLWTVRILLECILVSVAFVCLFIGEGSHVTIIHDALDPTIQWLPPGPHCTGTPSPVPPRSDIWWPRLEACSNLFTWKRPTSGNIWWLLKHVLSTSRR